MQNIEIISLVYKSVEYLNLIVSELKKDYCKVDDYDVGIRVVANDPTEKVIASLKGVDVPYTIYNDPKPDDYYMNRVYRCYNQAVKESNYDNVCLINSDMVFSNDWLKNLLILHDGCTIPCSRLIESGKMPSGKYGVSADFGKTPNTLNYGAWYTYVDTTKVQETHEGGLYMPCVFNKTHFIEVGMYPEGNIYQDGKAGSLVGGVRKSGDNYFFDKLITSFGMKHITVFNSLVYHIQEGEKDE